MENTSNADNQSPDQALGGSQKGLSPQNNTIENDLDDDAVVYAGLGVNNEPDILNPGDEEASDTLLYTDTATARHATNAVSNDEEADEFADVIDDEDLSEDDIEQQIEELSEEEDAGNERYESCIMSTGS